MAAFRSKKMAIPFGSASWISSERDAAVKFIQQEEEEFEYSVINEMEWLNEHMAEIFSKARKAVVDILKTPGKLRGKTPRTTRKRDATEPRAPLTDIFAPNQQAASGSPGVIAHDASDASDDRTIEDVPMSDNHSQLENTRSSSHDGSSPVQSILRKSSLSFANLPTRDPLGTKASIGARVSRTSHLEASALHVAGHTGIQGHQTGSVGAAVSQPPQTEIDQEDDHLDLSAEKPALVSKNSENDLSLTQLHRKTSTQQLHERISQLGQSHQARTSRSIPSLLQQATLSDVPVSPQASVPSEVPKPVSQQDVTKSRYDDSEEDWIPPPLPASYAGASQTTITRSNTTLGKKFDDEPLSASKAKLSAMFKSARGILASSAETSAQAKLESMAQLALAQPVVSEDAELKAPEVEAPEEKQPEEEQLEERQPEKKQPEDKEREVIASEVNEPEPIQPDLIEPPHRQSQRKRKPSDEDINMVAEVEHPAKVILAEENGATVQGTDSSHTQSQPTTRSMKDVKRPAKPGNVATSKAKPVPVAIKVGMTLQRELDHRKVNPSNSTLSSNLQQSLAPTIAPSTRQTRPVATNLRKVTTETTFKSSVSSQPPRPRALAAAARKKEQDEREAQRKLEAKREMERKRLAHQEEEKKKEHQRREMELQRQREQAAAKAEDPKKTAQKQVIEKRRLENARKQEQQRNGPMQTRARNGNNLASAMQKEKAQTQLGPSVSRGELSNARTVSKMQTATNVAGPSEELNRGQPQINPARPPKRVAQVETANERPFGPPSKVTSTYVQADSKRRKTNGEDDIIIEGYEANPPLIQQNTFYKDTQQSKLASTSQDFDINTPLHHGAIPSTSFRPTSLAQHNLQANKAGVGYSHSHPDMAKFANTKIPFADNQGNDAGPSTIRKNPLCLNGENKIESPEWINPSDIELPEIPTDSEEEDDEDDYYADMRKQLNLPGKKKRTPFKVPDWAKSPALREQLLAQQLIDPRTVWGPIPPIDLEKEFKFAGPKRLASYRNRTSSAYWGSDRLTEEEVQKDMEARRKLMEQGHWSRDIYK